MRDYVKFYSKISEYEIVTIEATNYKGTGSGPEGAESIIVEGIFRGKHYDVYIGLLSNAKTEAIMTEIAKNDSIQLNVFYSPSYGIRYEGGLSKSDVREKYLIKIIKTLIFLNGPSILCLALYIYYKRKTSNVRNKDLLREKDLKRSNAAE